MSPVSTVPPVATCCTGSTRHPSSSSRTVYRLLALARSTRVESTTRRLSSVTVSETLDAFIAAPQALLDLCRHWRGAKCGV
jgi:hypothetical protein